MPLRTASFCMIGVAINAIAHAPTNTYTYGESTWSSVK